MGGYLVLLWWSQELHLAESAAPARSPQARPSGFAGWVWGRGAHVPGWASS